MSTDALITKSKTHAYKLKTKENLSDNYNAISVDIFSPKTNIGKNSWYFINSLRLLKICCLHKKSNGQLPLKGTVMQIEKTLKNDCLRVLKLF